MTNQYDSKTKMPPSIQSVQSLLIATSRCKKQFPALWVEDAHERTVHDFDLKPELKQKIVEKNRDIRFGHLLKAQP